MSHLISFYHTDFKHLATFVADVKLGKLKDIEILEPTADKIRIKVNHTENLKDIVTYVSVDCSWFRILYNMELEYFKIWFPLLNELKLIRIDIFMCEYIKMNENEKIKCMLSNLNEKDIYTDWLFLAVECANLDAVYLLVKYKVDIYKCCNYKNILQFASIQVDKPTKVGGPIGLKIYNYIDSIYKFKYAPESSIDLF